MFGDHLLFDGHLWDHLSVDLFFVETFLQGIIMPHHAILDLLHGLYQGMGDALSLVHGGLTGDLTVIVLNVKHCLSRCPEPAG